MPIFDTFKFVFNKPVSGSIILHEIPKPLPEPPFGLTKALPSFNPKHEISFVDKFIFISFGSFTIVIS